MRSDSFMVTKILIWESLKMCNKPFTHSAFDSEIIRFYLSYFPSGRQNCIRSSTGKGKEK